MKIGIKFSGIKVDGEIIIDGHHRYVASLLAGVELERHPSQSTSATKIIDWIEVDVEDDDWDTEAKILMLNKKDAEFNGINLDEILELINNS